MHNTHFTNSTGLTHSDHYSTAHDLALLAAAIIRDFPERYPLYSLREYTYNGITQQNRNRLLWTDPNVDGMKTGWTEAAGYCLVTSAKRDQRRLISVVMGTASPNARSIESQRLLNYGFQFFDTAHPYKKDQPVANVQIWKGAQNKLKVGFDRDIYFSAPQRQSRGIEGPDGIPSAAHCPDRSWPGSGNGKVHPGWTGNSHLPTGCTGDRRYCQFPRAFLG